ncbi:hypothetical protein Ciccas_010787 [Cichlidogyrus casuarinus]|uniref:Homeobox domain-containing protein n=1 Tax=Cichlidogyrus casuarinus TaxID=1844966 RepID=A0ABD2PTP8_9PLAT
MPVLCVEAGSENGQLVAMFQNVMKYESALREISKWMSTMTETTAPLGPGPVNDYKVTQSPSVYSPADEDKLSMQLPNAEVRQFFSSLVECDARSPSCPQVSIHQFASHSFIFAGYFRKLARVSSGSSGQQHGPKCVDRPVQNPKLSKKAATRETTSMLKSWLNEHKKNPYPTKGEKIMLAVITRMNLTQVSTWFANARRRLKKENKMTWNPRNRHDSFPVRAALPSPSLETADSDYQEKESCKGQEPVCNNQLMFMDMFTKYQHLMPELMRMAGATSKRQSDQVNQSEAHDKKMKTSNE